MGFTAQEVSALENYAYLWKITGAGWRQEFVRHPRGFGEEFTQEDREELSRLNGLRRESSSRLSAAGLVDKEADGAGAAAPQAARSRLRESAAAAAAAARMRLRLKIFIAISPFGTPCAGVHAKTMRGLQKFHCPPHICGSECDSD